MEQHLIPLAQGVFIDGAWRIPLSSGAFLRSCNPALPEQILWEQPVALEDVDRAVSAAQHAFRYYKKKPIDERVALLVKFKERLSMKSSLLAWLIAIESGKPLYDAQTEVQALLNKIDYYTTGPGRIKIDIQYLKDGKGYTGFHPHGVMAVIGPFNFPLSLSHGHIVPALLAGNTVVLKPSEQTPLVAQQYVQIFEDVGFPNGVLNLIQGDALIGSRLVAHPDVRGVLFTGSYAVGKHIQKLTIDQPRKILALEMGGKNSCIIAQDADQDLALYECLMSALMSAGQRCSATSQIIIVDDTKKRSRVKHYLERMRASVSSCVIGDPMDAHTFMGPLISARAMNHYVDMTKSIQKKGHLLCKGQRLETAGGGYFVLPQLLYVEDSALAFTEPALQEEIFGPSLVVYAAQNIDEALRIAQNTDYGLALSVFTSSEATFKHCLDESACGIVNWNRGTIGALGVLPFGGIGRSGNYRPAGSESLGYCTYPVATLVSHHALPPASLMPPGFALM